MIQRKPTFIIAEAGVNHNGSVALARELVDAARIAGADAVKFQTFKAERLVNQMAEKAEYQKKTTPRGERQLEMLRKLELSEKAHIELMKYCQQKGILFLSSPFDATSADFLDGIGVTLFKIPSGEITNLPLIAHIATKGRPVILSTGMCTLGEVETALRVIFEAGNKHVSILHCVTEYPTPVEAVNLRAMETMRMAFGQPVGYSDHTPGIEIAIAAVALGAEIIEKHLTLGRSLEGPDHKASLEPDEFNEMTLAIRNVEKSLGDGIKRPAACETKNIPIARKSAVAAKRITRGEQITPSHLTLKRPGHGIQPADLEKVYGLRARKNIQPDEVITWEKLR